MMGVDLRMCEDHIQVRSQSEGIDHDRSEGLYYFDST